MRRFPPPWTVEAFEAGFKVTDSTDALFRLAFKQKMRSSPPPWTVEAIDAGFKIIDSNKQSIAYVYGHADKRNANTAKGLTLDEARRTASDIAMLPKLLGKG